MANLEVQAVLVEVVLEAAGDIPVVVAVVVALQLFISIKK